MKVVILINSYVTLGTIMLLTFGLMNGANIYGMKKVGIFIIVIGLGIIVFTIFSSFTKAKTSEPKQVEMDKNKQRELNWYPLIGIGALGIGAVILKLASER